jgi:tetrahydromethanopterin S-methyltransferase subunit A
LGCEVCFPAVAVNALKVEGEACPVEPLEERLGWPPLPGDYTVIRYNAPVAVCALNSDTLVGSLAESKPDGLAIAGTLHTENLGIERVIKNTLANPHVRFLVLCGEDTQQAVGHLPGQSFECLFRNGLDERGRIVGARGKRPVLKNVSREEVQAFVQQVELVPMIGEENPAAVTRQILSCAERNPGAYPRPAKAVPIQHIQAPQPQRLTLDKAGYFVVYPDARRQRLMVEHYTNRGVLDCVLEGGSPAALYREAIERQFVTRLDHAAYLGQELARAEHALETGEAFTQDKAPGETEPAGATHTGCGCASGTCEEKVDE